MTLCREIQCALERTYQPTGIDIEQCLIGQERSRELAELAGWGEAPGTNDATTFFYRSGEDLRIAIYYGPQLIATLEAEDPRSCISHRNIHALVAFIEEITHAVHAGVFFRQQRAELDTEAFAVALETQAKVDIYWLLLAMVRHLSGKMPDAETRQWVRDQVFRPSVSHSAKMRRRYRLADRIAARFIARVQSLPTGLGMKEIRRFACSNLQDKISLARGRPRP